MIKVINGVELSLSRLIKFESDGKYMMEIAIRPHFYTVYHVEGSNAYEVESRVRRVWNELDKIPSHIDVEDLSVDEEVGLVVWDDDACEYTPIY